MKGVIIAANTKDYLEVCYWIINVILLSITAFYIYYAPIKAVKIGRQLNDEQNKRNAQMNLFLNLFSLRGTPLNYNFVNGLNQIPIVFQGVEAVVTPYKNLISEFHANRSVLNFDLINNYKTEMFSEMAKHLGYSDLKNDQILQPYYPVGHGEEEQLNRELRLEALEFLKTSIELSKKMISIYEVQEEKEEQSYENTEKMNVK